METVLKSDVFFFITAIAVVVLTSILVPVLIQAYKTLRSVRHIAEEVEDEVTEARETLAVAREKLAVIPGLGFLSRGKADANKKIARKKRKGV